MSAHKDKVVLITGGASGIGLMLVRQFLKAGAHVGVLDKSEEKLTELARDGGIFAGYCGDVRDLAAHQSLVAAAVEKFGKVDTYICNAGIWDWGAQLDDLDQAQIDQAFDEVMHINVKGYLYGAIAALPELRKSKGALILTLSNAAVYSDGGGVLYTASKHAGMGVVKQLAYENAPLVRVNGVAIGAAESDLRGPASLQMGEQSVASLNFGEHAHHILPIGGLPTEEQYAGPFLYLADVKSSGASTGIVIEAHGGLNVRGFTKPYASYEG